MIHVPSPSRLQQRSLSNSGKRKRTMAIATLAPSRPRSLADLLENLGNIPTARIRLIPPIGTATEKDVLAIYAEEKVLCELVDGVLVEKAVGYFESALAMALGYYLHLF